VIIEIKDFCIGWCNRFLGKAKDNPESATESPNPKITSQKKKITLILVS